MSLNPSLHVSHRETVPCREHDLQLGIDEATHPVVATISVQVVPDKVKPSLHVPQ